MVIKSCLSCKFHEAKQEGKESISYGRKENCWSEFSKCLAKKALANFLEQENARKVL